MRAALIFVALIASTAASAQTKFLTTSNRVSVTLAWDQSQDPSVLGYHVYYGAGSRQYTNLVTALPRTNCLTTISGLIPGAQYYLAATCFNAALESDYSGEITWTAPQPLVPPDGIKTTNAVVSVTLQTAPSPAGPWIDLAVLAQGVSTPGFYRSMVTIATPSLPATNLQKLLSPKDSSQ